MLITLCYVYMWVRFHRCYSALIRHGLSQLRQGSFSFCVCSCSATAPSASAPSAGCPTGATRQAGSPPPEDNVFLQLGDKAVYVTEPQACDDLSKWTLLLAHSLVPGTQQENVSFIIEATGHRVSYPSPTKVNKKVLNWSDYCLPLARSPGQPFRAVAQATVENFSRLGVAFIEDRLQLDNGLLPSKIVPVVLEESTLNEWLVKNPQFQTSATSQGLCPSQNNEVFDPSPKDLLASDHQHTHCHIGSHLLSPQPKRRIEDRRRSEPLHGVQDVGLGDCPEDHSSGNHHHMEDHGQHLHLSRCHECLELENSTILSVKYASAENIPDLPDDNSVKLDRSTNTLADLDDDDGCTLDQNGDCDSTYKPPNVLVYTGAGGQERYQTVRQVLSNHIHTDNYVIYHLRPQEALSHPWLDNTRLLVLAEEETLSPELQTRFLSYLSQGGKVMGLASTLCPAGLCLEDSYWQKKKLNRLSFIREDNTELELSVLASGRVYVRDNQGGGEVELWGELKGHAPHQRDMVIVRITHGQDGGEAVLCQVHLDMAAESLTTEDFDELKVSNALRCEVLTEILTSLGLSCETNNNPAPTPIHLLATSQRAKTSFLKWLATQADPNGVLTASNHSLRMVSSSQLEDASLSPGSLLVTNSSESQSWPQFRMEIYKKNLETSVLGHTLLYAEVVSSTMDLLNGLPVQLPKDVGLIVVAGRQNGGRGRGNNTWLSPLGCAMFTLHVQVEMGSRLGQRIPFLQHMAALAVVEAIRTKSGYQDIDLRVKWPNDIYYSNVMKLGGVLVTSTVLGSTFYLLIGCGVNVTNSNPTMCINDLIQQHNIQHNCSLQPFCCAQVAARTANCLEALIGKFQQGGPDAVLPTYYKRWVHGGTKVRLWSEDGEEADVVGLDHNGFLQVHSKEQGVVSVEPDGNSFDMLKNLVVMKQR